MIKVFADFNCPFCFVQHQRMAKKAKSTNIAWWFIEHAPSLNSQVPSPAALNALNQEYDLICERAPDIPFGRPKFCVNTRLAILSIISIELSAVDYAEQYRAALFEAYWLDGKDISQLTTLRNILHSIGVDTFELHDDAETVLQKRQHYWQEKAFDLRIPAMESDAGNILLGLQHSDTISAFIEDRTDTGTGTNNTLICKALRENLVALIQAQDINTELARHGSGLELIHYDSLNDLIKGSEDSSPELIVLDFDTDRRKNFQTIDILCNPNISIKDVPIVYYLNSRKDESLAYTLGASEVLFAEDSVDANSAKLRRRLVEAKKLRQLSAEANIDELTGLNNRREFEKLYHRLWRICSRKKLSLSIIMIDVDHFKRFNDSLGHLQGDYCLSKVAENISHSVQRSSDIVARYGGEEFVVALFDAGLEQSRLVAEKIRTAVEAAGLSHPENPDGSCVTVTLGVCITDPHPDTSPTTAIDLADKALYDAKKRGRNQVRILTLDSPEYGK